MKAIFAEHISCSGDTHDFIIAVFTTQEKAEIFLGELKKHWPEEHFVVLDYIPPIIDPKKIDEVDYERTCDES